MKKDSKTQEKRKNIRFRVLSLMRHATEPDVATVRVTNVRNISRGGIAFIAEQKIEVGAVLRISFLPPNRPKPAEARGRVVRCPPFTNNTKVFEVGIQFLEVSEDGMSAIQELEVLFS